MLNKLVSCIVVTYNRKNMLERTLNSLLNSTYKNIEIMDVRHEDGLILVKGQVPGAKNSIVYIRKQN